MSLTVNGSPTSATVAPGGSFSASYSFDRDKTGGAVALFDHPGGIYTVGLPDLASFLNALGTIAWAPMDGKSGTVTLQAPSTPGVYQIGTVYPPDGGTLDIINVGVDGSVRGPAPATSGGAPAGSAAPAAPTGVGGLTKKQIAIGAGVALVALVLLR